MAAVLTGLNIAHLKPLCQARQGGFFRAAGKRDNAYGKFIEISGAVLGDHGHPRGAGHAHQAHPQQAAWAGQADRRA